MKWKESFLFILSFLFFISPVYSQSLGLMLQINTHFQAVKNKPTWLLIIRDMQTGVVIPYLYDVRNNDNYWLAFTYGHSYKITVSELQFEGRKKRIHNFCNLQNGVLSGISMMITLTGKLTTNRDTTICHVIKYKQT